MFITSVLIKQFRCFSQLTLSFEKRAILIEGLNGTGKTSLLEALHYACYLRSFRTHVPAELIEREADSFFVKLMVGDGIETHDIQVGFSKRKRVVKVNQKQIGSYKDLLGLYRVITLTEDDLDLIKDGPEIRRIFIDQAVLMHTPDYNLLLKKLRHTVDSRNALIKSGKMSGDSYQLWTERLDEISNEIRLKRIEMMNRLVSEVDLLITEFFGSQFTISCAYSPKNREDSDNFRIRELALGRTLYGAHLDDFSIDFKQHKSRIYASRGQQKLIIMLFKIAQVRLLGSLESVSPIFLLDDFITDLDEPRALQLVSVLKSLECQLLVTAPASISPLYRALEQLDYQRISISG